MSGLINFQTMASDSFVSSIKTKNKMHTTLILGATGKTGKRIAEKLQNLNQPIRLGSRHAAIPFDWNLPQTWTKALEGITKVYIAYQPDLAVPGALETVTQFTKAAQEAGIQKLVLLSGRGEKEAQRCEEVVRASSMQTCVIRASWFMQNFSEGHFSESIRQGHLVIPQVNTLEPFVDADDIADVAVECLMDPQHNNRIYELTGPELLSFGQVIDKLSLGLKREITLEQVPMDDYVGMLRQYQVPGDFIGLVTYLFTEVLDGRNASIKTDIEEVLKRKPYTLDQYITKTLHTKHWS